jgi:hypothetical protein
MRAPKLLLAALFLGFFLARPLFAEDATPSLTPEQKSAASSLFFTPSELDKIAIEVNKTLPAPKADILRLEAILYFGPTHWKVWLGGKSFAPNEANDKEIHIVKVTPDSVSFTLNADEGKEAAPVTLHLHETYNRRAK